MIKLIRLWRKDKVASSFHCEINRLEKESIILLLAIKVLNDIAIRPLYYIFFSPIPR